MKQVFNFIYDHKKLFLIALCVLFALNVLYCTYGWFSRLCIRIF
nr:MAG TPA: Geminivirus putative movement protein [Caudoviricetes sp.]